MIEQRRWSVSLRRTLGATFAACLLVLTFGLTQLDGAVGLLVAAFGLAVGVVGVVAAVRTALSTDGVRIRGTGLTGTAEVGITDAAVERWPLGLVGKADHIVLRRGDDPAFHVPLLFFSRPDQAEIRQTLAASGPSA